MRGRQTLTPTLSRREREKKALSPERLRKEESDLQGAAEISYFCNSSTRISMMRRLVFGVSVLFLISIPSVWAEPDADIRMFDARVLSNSFVSAIEKVSPAVVSINGERKFNSEDRERINGIIQELPESFRDMLDLIPDRQRWQGSGMMIRADGLILTNYHVLEGAEKLSAQFADGREFRGEIAGHDPYTDIALLQLENCPGDLPTVSLGDSDTLRVGEWVLAIGSPFRLFGSVSEGIVSAKNRTGEDVPLDNENRLFMYKDFIQTTAAINIGNSGGPLINLDGEVIGINNSIQTAGTQANLGIGFAIPSNMARFVVESLLANGHVVRGWLGVQIDSLKNARLEDWGTLQGALITDVRPNTPAAQAGLEVGDVIVAFNSHKVGGGPQLQNLVTQTPVGSTVLVSVFRDKEKLDLQVTVEELPRYLLTGTSEWEEILMGFAVEELTDANREKYGYPAESHGVVITEILPGSHAEKSGLRPGDLILEMNEPTPDKDSYMEQVGQAANRVAERKEITLILQVDRADAKDGFPRYVSVKVEDPLKRE